MVDLILHDFKHENIMYIMMIFRTCISINALGSLCVGIRLNIEKRLDNKISITVTACLLISACFSHASSSLVYVLHASKKHALISKRLL